MEYATSTALVTGASSGIGAAYARRLASSGSNLILVARRRSALEELAAQLRSSHGVRVDVVAADLARPGAGADLATRVGELGRTVDVLVNNAGFGGHGDVAHVAAAGELGRLLEMVQLNCSALLELTGLFLPGMVERDRGQIVNVASTIAFQPMPHMATYGATKAFVLSLTEALWVETRGTGVRVLALCPGATGTGFFDAVGRDDIAVGRLETPEQVVDTAFRALARRSRPTVVSGWANKLLSTTNRFSPRWLTAIVAGRTVPPSEPVLTGARGRG